MFSLPSPLLNFPIRKNRKNHNGYQIRKTACILAENRKPDAQKKKNRNRHQNRKTEFFRCKHRKTDLKNGRNRKTEDPNAPLLELFDIMFHTNL